MAGAVLQCPGLAEVEVTEHHMLALGSRTNSHTVDVKPFIRDSHIALWETGMKPSVPCCLKHRQRKE